MGVTILAENEENLDEAEKMLINYRFTRGLIRCEIDEFISSLPEPYQTFAICRYKHSYTMIKIAVKMSYSLRSMYVFRKKVLKWWNIWMGSDNNERYSYVLR